ncbi:MAG: HAMP domain-containing histidine kinase [Ruminococcus sp.]|nr:HAMP domain-containing histidine kinase [Ruminococcus sp.]
MFKKSRRKIVAAIMSILVLLFLGTLAVIYSSSYFEVSSRNYDMLERHAELYSLRGFSEDTFGGRFSDTMEPLIENPKNKPNDSRFEDTPTFQLSTFYSVAISKDGDILEIDNRNETVYTKETLEKYASDILKSNKNRGIKNSLMFIVLDKGKYTLVTFMDNTVMQESMTTLFRYTLVFGGIAIIALFFLAVYLAKRIVKPLEESYQKQKQFISDAGHELKTPVSVVNANAELLSREIGDNQWLTNIQYENERMGKLVSQLLELARTENVTPQTEHLDLSRLVIGGALPFESVAFEKGLVLNMDISDGIFVDGNSSQLSQLVSILIDNAIRHGQDGKEVGLTLNENRNSVILSVTNAGKPIPQEETERLFERFYRADETRNGEDKHYGLGLAIAKSIVTAHKGRIEVKCYNGIVEFRVALPKA